MSGIFDDTEDLDPDFKPEDVALSDTDNNKTQPDGDVVMLTHTDPPIEKDKAEENMPSLKDLLSTKLVLASDKQAKVVNVQDIHDAIVATEGISRSTAELISLSCEDFLGPRLRLNEFTGVNSKINFNYSKAYLVKKIATEKAELKVMLNAATEDVMQYAASMLERSVTAAGKPVVEVDTTISSINKGLYVRTEDGMVNVFNMDTVKLLETLNSAEVDNGVSASIKDFFNYFGVSRTNKYIFSRAGGTSVETAVAYMVQSQDVHQLSLAEVFTYFKDSYADDIEFICHQYEYLHDHNNNLIEAVKGADGDAEATIAEAKKALSGFLTMEAYEELKVVLPFLVGLANKILQNIKY